MAAGILRPVVEANFCFALASRVAAVPSPMSGWREQGTGASCQVVEDGGGTSASWDVPPKAASPLPARIDIRASFSSASRLFPIL